MSYEKKCSSLEPPKGALSQINPVDVNLHLQNSLEIFDKNSAAKRSDPKITRVGKCPALCQLGLRQDRRNLWGWSDCPPSIFFR